MTYNDNDNERAHIIDSDEDVCIFTPTFPENYFDVLYFFPLFFINFMKSNRNFTALYKMMIDP